MSDTSRRTLLPLRHRAYPWIALVAGIVMLARAASTVTTFNHTTDEPAHIGAAVTFYEAHKLIYMVEHPPLQRLVVGGALRLAGASTGHAEDATEVRSRHEANWAGATVLFHGKLDYWKVLVIARLANLVFPAIALLYLYLLGRYLANSLVAMLAVVFCSLDPNLIAHSGLAGTDVTAVAGFLIATYHGLRFIARPRWGRGAVAGIALGIGLSCKFTCLFIIPALGLIVIIRSIRRAIRRGGVPPPSSPPSSAPSSSPPAARERPSPLRAFFASWPSAGKLALLLGIAFVTLWATYLFNIGPIGDQSMFEKERAYIAIPQWVKDTPIPMPSAVLGNMFLASLNRHGFRAYLNGHPGLSAGPLYFPEALAIKSPIGLLAAFALAVILFIVIRRRPWRAMALLVPPAVLLAVSCAGKLQIGIRHVLPMLPFLYLFAAFMLYRGRKVILLGALIGLTAVESASIHPDYLAFFNQLAGGPRQGHKYLGDSNLDWGQDIYRLSQYMKSEKRPVRVRISGGIVEELAVYLRMPLEAFDPPHKDMIWGGVDEMLRESGIDAGLVLHPPDGGLFAVSNDVMVRLEGMKIAPRCPTSDGRPSAHISAGPGLRPARPNEKAATPPQRSDNDQHGTTSDKKSILLPPDYSWLKRYPVARRIGYSITVYDLDRPPSPANNPAANAAQSLP